MKPLSAKLPILISVPHGGMKIPQELQKKCLIDPEGILRDGDTWSRELYDFRDSVEEYVDTDIARLVIDMNRREDDLPPANPDGVVKTTTVDRSQVWDQPSGLSPLEIQYLIKHYHTPYHQRLLIAAKNRKVIIGIDCHTMLDILSYPDGSGWEKRPLFCIGNRGCEMGLPLNEPITAPTKLVQKLQENLQQEFVGFVPNHTQQPLVTLNKPFSGGYITYHHGSQGDIPWLQLEINRRLYLLDAEDISIIPNEFSRVRLIEIRDKLYRAFKSLIEC